jgi:hypothetical protein
MQWAVPVDPDAETARQWAEDELSKPEYNEGSGVSLDAFWRWLGELFARIGDAGGSIGIPGAVLVAIIVIAVLALVTWLVLGPLRRARRRDTEGAVFDDDARSWRDIRDSARGAAARGDWDLAVMEWFRATVRLAVERGTIVDSPGVTAHEAAARIGLAVPAASDAVVAGGDAFDRARYGTGGLDAAAAATAEQTFAMVEAARPAAAVSP